MRPRGGGWGGGGFNSQVHNSPLSNSAKINLFLEPVCFLKPLSLSPWDANM